MVDLEKLATYGVACGAFLAGALVAMATKLKEWWGNRKKKEQQKEEDYKNPLLTLERDLKIQDIITELRVKADADRVYICKFHNGGEYFDGTAIKKLSRTYESCKKGVSHETLSFQAVPTTLVTNLMYYISRSEKEDSPIAIHVEEVDNGFLRNHLVNAGVHVVVKYRLIIGKRLIGYIGLHFCSLDAKEKAFKVTAKMEELVKEAAGAIENIMTMDQQKTS